MYTCEAEFVDVDMDMIQKVVAMCDRNPGFRRFVSFDLQGLDYRDDDDVGDVDFGVRTWLPPPYYWTGDHPHLSAPIVQARESEAERNARLLEETRKSKEKAEKKKLKKQNQKRKKQLEKEKPSPVKAEEGERDAQQSKAEDTKPVDGKPKDDTDSSVKKSTSAQDAESSDGESSGEDSDTENDPFESEELDMTSTFVTKAALIAKRKMEQRPKPERKEKKVPVKESKTVPDRTKEEPEVENKPDQDSAACSIPTFEDHIKISTELAVIGNRYASTGDFNTAVKYFTDAIKYNPTEFKLFGNRSFCFEKMQEYEKALTDAELCVNLCPGWVKGMFRKGRALAGLKRYREAAQSFGEVLKLDGSYAEAAQELMRVQITQLMECGFTREQSSNALIIHGTVEEALAVLSNLNHRPGAYQSATLPAAQVVNITGVSPVLSANTYPAVAAYPQSHNALNNKPIGPVPNMSNIQSQHKPVPHQATKLSHENSRPPTELFPVWVGNLIYPVPESVITNVFNKAGAVYSVKVLAQKRCAFVNFTKQEHCDEAIRRFHGYALDGMKIAVRYPDRIPQGMGISRSALKAEGFQNENPWQNVYGSPRPVYPHRPVPEHKDEEKN
ncbi:tetratricopeptide repeat protein 31-like isoform X2 [Hippoglossus hippoglossus]|uniref:tetratricopeptide repeat protein 31-like isoform X2 n=1 Tax=Hippoglossus hippoglossus TaxID=8267 RepID=UPI00148BBAA2|nr:tetratricopeptide repeat protein 31-like isoform X2 [Hippoglossus hippoglossus]XP_035004910.1 tetratricopeptide repeat protein 31 isoform X2 [Hippoglossus stenolepis]